MNAKVISILAEKGGVGKTTLSLNLAGVLATRGYHVLAVDTDKQGNLSQFYFGEPREIARAWERGLKAYIETPGSRLEDLMGLGNAPGM